MQSEENFSSFSGLFAWFRGGCFGRREQEDEGKRSRPANRKVRTKPYRRREPMHGTGRRPRTADLATDTSLPIYMTPYRPRVPPQPWVIQDFLDKTRETLSLGSALQEPRKIHYHRIQYQAKVHTWHPGVHYPDGSEKPTLCKEAMIVIPWLHSRPGYIPPCYSHTCAPSLDDQIRPRCYSPLCPLQRNGPLRVMNPEPMIIRDPGEHSALTILAGEFLDMQVQIVQQQMFNAGMEVCSFEKPDRPRAILKYGDAYRESSSQSIGRSGRAYLREKELGMPWGPNNQALVEETAQETRSAVLPKQIGGSKLRFEIRKSELEQQRSRPRSRTFSDVERTISDNTNYRPSSDLGPPEGNGDRLTNLATKDFFLATPSVLSPISLSPTFGLSPNTHFDIEEGYDDEPTDSRESENARAEPAPFPAKRPLCMKVDRKTGERTEAKLRSALNQPMGPLLSPPPDKPLPPIPNEKPLSRTPALKRKQKHEFERKRRSSSPNLSNELHPLLAAPQDSSAYRKPRFVERLDLESKDFEDEDALVAKRDWACEPGVVSDGDGKEQQKRMKQGAIAVGRFAHADTLSALEGGGWI
ncbi:MAG: hypothetical protein M1820_007486 [Bogoriella megaspora]|nr:MAG: hypothetical protein M1820_007486 [Bogoriella megaspora]